MPSDKTFTILMSAFSLRSYEKVRVTVVDGLFYVGLFFLEYCLSEVLHMSKTLLGICRLIPDYLDLVSRTHVSKI